MLEVSLGNGKQEGTQLMILDKTFQKMLETELDHLINIPIEMQESSGILKKILGIDQGNQENGAQKVNKRSRRNGSACMKGKENQTQRTEGKMVIESNNVIRKIQWRLRDKESEHDEETEANKIIKALNEALEVDNCEVGVASLKWLQMHQ